MRSSRWDFLVIIITLAVLYLARSWPQARSDKAQDFLTSLEVAVKAIAKSATENHDNTCGLQATCLSEQNCSRRECFPLDGQQTHCTYVYNFTICNASPDSQCNQVSVDYSRSLIRLPGNASVSFPDGKTKQTTFGPTVCTQRALDATFKAQKFSYSNESFFYNLYFGAADGVLRVYPAKDVLNGQCNTLEPRARSWYINAISVRKDVVVVMDTGARMRTKHFLSGISSLDTAKNLTRTLAQNLSAGDTLTLIGVNSTGSFPLGRPSEMSGDWSATADSLSVLLDNPALNGMGAGDENPSQFKAAFEMANSTSGHALKIIVLFTDSGDGNVPPSDLVSSTLGPIKATGGGLFVYDLSLRDASSLWDSGLCNPPNNSESLNLDEPQTLAQQNPFLFLNSYFSFLARARIEANNGSLAFWTEPHQSTGDLGEVMTVSFPVMSSDSTVLLGVAGIDVQTGGLSPDLKAELERLLDSDAYHRRTSIPTILTLADTATTCVAGYLKSCTGNEANKLWPFCNSSAEPASDAVLRRLLCCSGQGCSTRGSTGHHGSSHLRIVCIVMLPVMAVLLVSLATLYIIPKIRTRPPATAPQLIPWEELYLATNRFDDGNIIGKGAFGVVYRGLLRGQKVAVKKLVQVPDRSDDFQAELKVNMRITKHPHLVELKGACFPGRDCYLVYELVEGGDLFRWMWPEPNVVRERGEDGTVIFLTWNRRKQVAQGIANGLDYLHRGLLPDKIFHLDIKPRNILLERNFSPKIADFGISQLYESGRTFDIAAVKGGSFGYMAPEVPQGHLPNEKMDVFSFGVVLMQLISGRRIDDQDLRPSFIQWARNMVKGGHINVVIDDHLLQIVEPRYETDLFENCRKMIDVAMDCTEPDPERRPEMHLVLRILTNLREVQELEIATE